MKRPRPITFGIYFFGVTEIVISVFILFNIITGRFCFVQKISSVFFIVLSLITFVLGLGIIFNKELARVVLVTFSILIVINKVLIFCGLVDLPYLLTYIVSEKIKDIMSLIYHLLIAVFFNRPMVVRIFEKK